MMPDFPTISVVIPVHNRAHCIGRAIHSILEQTLPAHEIIIVDDGSTDQTVQAALAAYPRCRIVRFEKNRGAQAARAEGIKVACGEWVAFLDSDDWWLPKKLEWQIAKTREGFDVIHGNAWIQKKGRRSDLHVPGMEGNIYPLLLAKSGPLYQCLLVRRSCFDKAGLPDAAISSYQEWDTSLILAKHFAFGYINEPLFVYEVQENSISKNDYKKLHGFEQIVTKWWKEILSVAGPEAGYWHYKTMARLSRPLQGLSGEAHYLFLGARLSGLPRYRALKDLIKNRLRFLLVYYRRVLSKISKHQP